MLNNLNLFSTECRVFHNYTFLVRKIFTFYINDVLLFKCPVPGPKVKRFRHNFCLCAPLFTCLVVSSFFHRRGFLLFLTVPNNAYEPEKKSADFHVFVSIFTHWEWPDSERIFISEFIRICQNSQYLHNDFAEALYVKRKDEIGHAVRTATRFLTPKRKLEK